MKILKNQNLFKFLFSAILAVFMLILQSCGPLESLSGDSQVIYDKDFDTMVEVVERAIRGRSLIVNFAEKSDDGERYVVMFHATSYVKNQAQRKNQGEIIIERISDNKTKITINNPDYHYSLPSHHREKYDEELKKEIDKILQG